MADTIGQAEIRRNYPVVSGINADSKTEGRKINLVPTTDTLIPRRYQVGL